MGSIKSGSAGHREKPARGANVDGLTEAVGYGSAASLCSPSSSRPSKPAAFGGSPGAAVVCELVLGADNITPEEHAKLRCAQDEVQLATSPSDALSCSGDGVEVAPQRKVLRWHPAEVF